MMVSHLISGRSLDHMSAVFKVAASAGFLAIPTGLKALREVAEMSTKTQWPTMYWLAGMTVAIGSILRAPPIVGSCLTPAPSSCREIARKEIFK